jgi:dihydroorotate dehydrogenase
MNFGTDLRDAESIAERTGVSAEEFAKRALAGVEAWYAEHFHRAAIAGVAPINSAEKAALIAHVTAALVPVKE